MGGVNESRGAPTCCIFKAQHTFDAALPELVVCWWWLGLEGCVPPPVGALTGGARTWGHRGWGPGGWARQRSRAEPPAGVVGDHERVCSSGEGDHAAVVQPVMIRTDQRVSHESLAGVGGADDTFGGLGCGGVG